MVTNAKGSIIWGDQSELTKRINKQIERVGG